VGVDLRMFAADGAPVKVTGARLNVPTGWNIESEGSTTTDNQNPFARREMPTHSARYRVTVPADAPLTQPYFLADSRQGDTYQWPSDAPKGLPFGPPPLTGRLSLEIGGTEITLDRPVQYRYADRVRGELRRDVEVVPLIAVGLDSRLLIVPLGSNPNEQRVVVRASSFSSQPVMGSLQLRLPQGWTSTPTTAPITLKAKGDKTSATFVVTAPARRTVGAYDVTAEARANGGTFSRDVQVVSYPHIQTHRLYWPATATAQVVDLNVAPVRVGYVMGSGDQVPEALRRIGMDVTLVNDEMLTTGDLSQFDTIVVGIRASEARPEFVANNGRLLQYVERGGTMIVQYQQGDYVARGLPPYPASSSGNERVTDETAPVRVLAPGHPVFTFPNRITATDFNGWVQERNLYSWATMDPRYTPLLESADAGEPPARGGEVYADVGKGRYVYTSYAWFRQLPAGVPGAYRQFANLVSLSKAPRR
jgi:alpha-galactosidase-like protein